MEELGQKSVLPKSYRRRLAYLLLFCTLLITTLSAQEDEGPPQGYDEVPDSKYGKGGYRIAEEENSDTGSFYIVSIYDPGGTLREKYSLDSNNHGSSERHHWYDCKGRKTSFFHLEKDSSGNEILYHSEDYRDGKISYGFKRESENGKITKLESYDPETQVWKQTDPSQIPKTFEPIVNKCPATNTIITDGSLVFEDAQPNHFITKGIMLALLHPITQKLGIIGDVGISWGTEKSVDYLKLQFMAGPGIFISKRVDRIKIIPHLLAGVSTVRAKYINSSSSSSSFCMAIGADVFLVLNKTVSIDFRADYNPSFPAGGVKNNFRTGAGLAWKL